MFGFLGNIYLTSCLLQAELFSSNLSQLLFLSLFQVSNKGEKSFFKILSIFWICSFSLMHKLEGFFCLLIRGLQQTMCLQHQLQPNLQTLFPHCSRLQGTALLLPPLLLSQLKSRFTAVCSHLFSSVSFFSFI